MSDVNDAQDSLICPNTECQRVLRGPGVEMVNMAFPYDYEALKQLLAGVINKARCPTCDTVVIFDPFAILFFRPTFSAWVYAPPAIRGMPGVVDRILGQMKQSLKNAGFPSGREVGRGQVEFLDTFDAAAGKMRDAIRKVYLDCFQGFLASRAQDREDEWIKQNIARLDADFFTALQLVLDERLPVRVTWQGPAGGARPTKADVIEELNEIRVRLVMSVFEDVAIDFLKTEKPVQHMFDRLQERIPSCVLDERQVLRLAALAESLEKYPTETGKAAYITEASVAWAALSGQCTNPRAAHWVAQVAQLERDQASRSDRLIGLRMSDEFLRKTVDHRRLMGYTLSVLVDDTLPADIESRLRAAMPLIQLAERLGMVDSMAELAPHMLNLQGLDTAPEEVISQLFAVLLRGLGGAGGVGAYAEIITRAIHAKRIAPAMKAIEEAVAQLASAERWTAASTIQCRAAEALNDTHEHGLAERILDSWIKRLKHAGDWDHIDVSARLDVINELGNTLRYIGRLREAISLYEGGLKVSTESSSKYQHRVLLGNLGRACRDLGRVREGLTYIQQSMEQEMTPVEHSSALHSIALCHALLGEHAQAADYLQAAIKALDEQDSKLFARERIRLLFSLAKTYRELGDFPRAFAAVEEARRLAAAVLHSPFDETVCAVLLVDIGLDVLPSDQLLPLINMMEQRLLSLPQVSSAVIGDLVLMAAYFVMRMGDQHTGERLIALAERAPGETLVRNRWRIDGLKSWAALKSEDLRGAHAHLQQAWRTLVASLEASGPTDVALTYFEDRRTIQILTSSLVQQLLQANQVSSTLLCVAAELQSSVLQDLSLIVDKEARSAFLSQPLQNDWLMDDISFLVKTGPTDRPTAFVQFLWDTDGYRPLISQQQPGGGLDVRLEQKIANRIILDAAAEVRFSVQTYNPALADSLPADLPNWGALADRLAVAVRNNIPSGAHLCVVPTHGLNHLPVHLMRHPADGQPLIADYTFSYVPSIFVAARLRERRLAQGRGPDWRPQRAGNFVVWLTADAADLIESFKSHSRMTQDFLERQGVSVVSCEGTSATKQLFDRLLEESELLHICCHGAADLPAQTHQLFVSDCKSLPPSALIARANPSSDEFVLDWDSIRTKVAPSVVVSCACSSGASSLQAAGERVGFERTLFQRGTHSLIAPLWDITGCEIHRLTEAVLQIYYSSPRLDLGRVIQTVILNGLARKDIAHAAGALALMGDWL